jgi:hypothetical protein
VRDVLRQKVTLPSVAEWSQVTPPGDSPEISVRYQADLGDPAVAASGMRVRTTLPIHYFGAFRARARTPFGWLWLTKDTPWGTSARRGTIEVQVDTLFSVSPDWRLGVRSSLADLRLKAPPVEKLCTSGVFKVCVPAEWVRERVHREIDRQVRAQASRGLAEADAQISSGLDLARLVNVVWERLHAEVPEERGETLAIAPRGLALGPAMVRGDSLLLELVIWSQPQWAVAHHQAPTALPSATQLAATGRDEHLDIPVSLAALSERMTKGLRAAAPGTREVASELKLLGPADEPGRWLIGLVLAEPYASRLVYGDATLALEGADLGLGDPHWSSASHGLLVAAGLSPDELARELAQRAHGDLTDLVRPPFDALHQALASSVSPWPVQFEESSTSLEAAYAADTGVVFRVRGR